MFINAAKQVQADDSYTQADLEFATAFMKELVVQAKEAVTTGVRSLTPDPSPKGEGSSNWFTLAGRKVKTPSLGEGRGGLTPGVYINNGVKTVIR